MTAADGGELAPQTHIGPTEAEEADIRSFDSMFERSDHPQILVFNAIARVATVFEQQTVGH